MEKMNLFFIVVIVAYLLYSYINSRKKAQKAEPGVSQIKAENIIPNKEGESMDLEKHAVAAAIAAVMDGKQYYVKKIIVTGKPDEKNSKWKVAGRQESMARRVFFSKK